MSTKDSIWSSYVATGLLAYERGDYDEAERDLKENLAALSNVVEHRQGIQANLFHLLANVYRERDRFEECDRLYTQAIETYEAGGEATNTTEFMRLYRDYALSLVMQGNFSGALSFERLALAIAESNAIVHRFELHTSLSRLASMAYAAADYARAKKYYLRLVGEREKSAKPDDPALRPLFADLGMVCYHLGEYGEAEEYLSRALSLGSQLDEEANVLRNDLGLALCAQSKNRQAQPFCRKSAAARAAKQEESISDRINDLSDGFCDKDKFSDARPLCEAASALREEAEDVADPLARKLSMYCRLLRRVNCCEKTDRIERRIKRLKN